ncbi:Detected protein of confused Function [Hibiscus syriacus]|uniref:Detected protein of confused Function n=2 Tax=Hibiscus syriacus TaxID=106335 RepID=A0A6A2Z0L7_HIBSY|nr:Detected protein of confused Function [Hibiscus syriacus]
MTPGSGEALLRGQVKTLLQKVEEEAELSKPLMESRPFIRLQGCFNSPMGISAPTPANTPQLSNLYEDIGLGSIVIAQPVVEERMKSSEEVSFESQTSVITRSLLLDLLSIHCILR